MGAGEAVPRAGDGWPLRPTLVRCAARCGRGHGRRVCDRRGVGLGEPLGELRIRLEPEGDFARVRVLHACRPTCSGRCSPPGATSGPCGRTCGGKSCDGSDCGGLLAMVVGRAVLAILPDPTRRPVPPVSLFGSCVGYRELAQSRRDAMKYLAGGKRGVCISVQLGWRVCYWGRSTPLALLHSVPSIAGVMGLAASVDRQGEEDAGGWSTKAIELALDRSEGPRDRWLDAHPDRGASISACGVRLAGRRRASTGPQSCSATPPQGLLCVTVTKVLGISSPERLLSSLGIAVGRL